MKRAMLDGGDRPKLRFHDCRHTFASLLIASGGTVVFVSRQLGHGSPDITLRVYAHLFDVAEPCRSGGGGVSSRNPKGRQLRSAPRVR
jgi:integrase